MKGQRTLDKQPFRYGGFFHEYGFTNDDWQEKVWSHDKRRRAPMRCHCCNGVMRNLRSPRGTLLANSYPYMAVFRITKGQYKGRFQFRILCRSCAYRYGRGVIEMDGETYMQSREFNEEKYKEQIGYGENTVDAGTGGLPESHGCDGETGSGG